MAKQRVSAEVHLSRAHPRQRQQALLGRRRTRTVEERARGGALEADARGGAGRWAKD